MIVLRERGEYFPPYTQTLYIYYKPFPPLPLYHFRSTLKSSSSSVSTAGGGGGGGGPKVKVKELSYPQVLAKGGGLFSASLAIAPSPRWESAGVRMMRSLTGILAGHWSPASCVVSSYSFSQTRDQWEYSKAAKLGKKSRTRSDHVHREICVAGMNRVALSRALRWICRATSLRICGS